MRFCRDFADALRKRSPTMLKQPSSAGPKLGAARPSKQAFQRKSLSTHQNQTAVIRPIRGSVLPPSVNSTAKAANAPTAFHRSRNKKASVSALDTQLQEACRPTISGGGTAAELLTQRESLLTLQRQREQKAAELQSAVDEHNGNVSAYEAKIQAANGISSAKG